MSNSQTITPEYTLSEEILNATTHGFGVIFGIIALITLTITSVKQHNDWKIVSSALFASSIILMYLASTLYHSISSSKPNLKSFFRTLDHSTIYLLIAGTYTPITLVSLSGGWGWSLFGIVWGLAIAGIIFKIFLTGKLEIVSLLFYLLMGWAALIAIKPIFHHIAFAGFMWLLAGGLTYTLGVLFYIRPNTKFMHSIWHLFVLAGTIFHFIMICNYVIEY